MKKNIITIFAMSTICFLLMTGCEQEENTGLTGKEPENKQTFLTQDDLWDKRPEEIKEYLADKCICFGTYPQEKDKDQPIEWIVLDVDEDKQLYLLSKNVLEVRQYDSRGKDIVKWKDSELREFLNNDFYNKAFNEEEKSAIILTELVNDKNDHGLPGGENTSDNVFVPSTDEILEYVPLDEWDEENIKGRASFLETSASDHAYYYKDPKTKKKEKYSSVYWEIFWLRLPQGEANEISVVGMGSMCPVGNMHIEAGSYQGVRLAIKVGPSSLTLAHNDKYDRWKVSYEKNMAGRKKREAYEQSQLYASACEYYENALKEIAPGAEFAYSLEPWIKYEDMDEEEFNVTIDSREKALKYFSIQSDIYVDYVTAGLVPEELIDELMKRGISGTMPCLTGRTSDGSMCEAWSFEASDGSVEINNTPGY